MNPFDDRLAVEAMLFYMNYVRSVGFIPFQENEVFRESCNDARLLVYRLMIRDFSIHRVKAVMRINKSENRFLHGRCQQIKRQLSDIAKALNRVIEIAPVFQGQPWPTGNMITIVVQSALNNKPLD